MTAIEQSDGVTPRPMAWGAVLFFLFFLGLGLPAWAQDEKPRAAVAPVAVLGDISEIEKRIIFNKLQAFFGKTYSLVSQEQYKRAEEEAFQELDFEQCTEEQCIRKIQELLQVERLIVLQILREKNFTQLVLTMVRGEDKIIETDECLGCDIPKLTNRISRLVAMVIRADGGTVARVAPALPQVSPVPQKDPGEPVGFLTVAEVARGSTFSLSGGPRGTEVEAQPLPVHRMELPPGNYRLRVDLPALGKRDYPVGIADKQETHISVADTFVEEGKTARNGAGGGLLAGAGLFMLLAGDAQSKGDDLWAQRDAARSEGNSEEENQLAADATAQDDEASGFRLLAVLSAIAGIVLFMTDADPGFEPISLAPMPTPGETGLGISYAVRW